MKNKLLVWIKAAGIRAVKTVAQTALSLISVGTVLSDIDWVMVASASVVAGIYSLLTSVAGLPELKDEVADEEVIEGEEGGEEDV